MDLVRCGKMKKGIDRRKGRFMVVDVVDCQLAGFGKIGRSGMVRSGEVR